MAETTTAPREPGDDIPVSRGSPGGDVTVINAVQEYKKEAENARRTRMHKNRENRNAYLGIQDWSHKTKGQSQEFLPRTPVAVEQFVGFAKRALTQFGSWYEMQMGRGTESPISGTTARTLLDCFLDDMLVEDNVTSNFATQLSSGLKVAALESLMIFKVHGNFVKNRVFVAEPGTAFLLPDGSVEDDDPELVAQDFEHWKLRVDLVDPTQYYKDPTNAGLYEIHSVERDLHTVVAKAEEGVYDKAAVARIQEDFTLKAAQDRREYEKGNDEASKPSFRRKVRIDEFWGTILDAEGKVVHRNVMCAIANDKYLIRKPTPNPFWHQKSPFLAIPLIQVPFSAWHKALMDHAVQINFAQNELFNLIIDGGISSVWGIKQVRVDDLEDPAQASDGFAQGDTIVVKNTLPHGQKVLEKVAEGEIPTDAMVVFEMLSREFAAASLSNELKLGSLPPKQVKATEIVELSQSQAITLDAIIGDVERAISELLGLIWLTVLQNLSDVSSERVVNAIGPKAAFLLGKMSPAERFATFASPCSFKVNGLSATLSKVRDFQKIMALLQSIAVNPILLQAFFKRYSPDRLLSHIMKTLAVNPEQIERDDEELQRLAQDLEELPQFQQLATGANKSGSGNEQQGGGAGLAAQDVGEPGLPAEINQTANPLSGLAGP